MEILVLLFLIVVNGVFVMSETALVSARKQRLQQRAHHGDVNASAALALASEPARFLPTVQIGITLIGILVGALSGAALTHRVTGWLSGWPATAPYSVTLGFILALVGVSFVSLIVGELVPKRLALFDPERIASAVARPVRLLSVAASPVVQLLSFSTDLVLRALSAHPSSEPPVTEEEINVLITQGTAAGVFEEAEHDLVRSVFRLGDRAVSSLMTPRLEIVWLDLEVPPEENQRKMAESIYSRFPVAHFSLDNVVGILLAKDLLVKAFAGQPFDLAAAASLPLYVPESLSALRLLETLKQSGKPAALVIDEYGGVQGLVTLNDVLQAIVGEVPSANEPADPDVVQREDGTWLLDGTLPVDEFKELLGLRGLSHEGEGLYQTLAGFVLMQLGCIPVVGDHFDWHTLRFEVLNMDALRIGKILVAHHGAAGTP
jgi:putative hemolysin